MSESDFPSISLDYLSTQQNAKVNDIMTLADAYIEVRQDEADARGFPYYATNAQQDWDKFVEDECAAHWGPELAQCIIRDLTEEAPHSAFCKCSKCELPF